MQPSAFKAPHQFIPATQGKITLVIKNQDAAETIYLHPEYEHPTEGWKIEHGDTLPPFEWTGGLLWISATAANLPYMVLRIEPKCREEQEKGAGIASGGGGGGGFPRPPKR